MTDNPRLRQLLDELLDSHSTPEEVCRTCPDLLPEVRVRWREVCRVRAQLDALFPAPTQRGADAPARPTEGAALPQVPGYEVEAVLGHGGMGVVYRAWHLRLHRPVALKMLLAGAHAQSVDQERLLREAEAVAGLSHANIVPVYEVGDVDGQPYFTMEFIEGGSLAQKLAGTPHPADRVAALVATIAEAIQVAHQSGILHRDLKPANILLTADGTPKVSDFGLARRLESAGGLTLSGLPVGTPSYMAPEQARGKSQALGPAVDVYALGAILYECLTGRPPFRGESPTETLLQVIDQEPVSPSRLNSKVARDLDRICLKCLHKDAKRRYASAQDLADDLHRFLAGKPVQARPVGAVERVVKWARRRPAAALLIFSLLVILVSAGVTGLWLHDQEMDRQTAKAHQEDQAREAIKAALQRADDRRKEERWEEALLILNEASSHIGNANSPSLEERLRRAKADFQFAADLQRVREDLPLDPNGRGYDLPSYWRLRVRQFQAALERGGLKVGSDLEPVVEYIQASAIRDQLIAAIDDWALASLMCSDDVAVERLLRIGRAADPEPNWRDRFRKRAVWHDRQQLLELANVASHTLPRPSGHHLALLAMLLKQGSTFDRSIELLGDECRRQPSDFWLTREMALTLRLQGRNSESISYFRIAIALRPKNAGVHDGLGWVLLNMHQLDEALAEFRQVVELSPDTGANGYLVTPLAITGRWKAAMAECLRALDHDPSNCTPPTRLTTALWEQRRDDEAIALLRKAVETGRGDADIYQGLGRACRRAGRHEDAVTAFRKVTDLLPASLIDHQYLALELEAAGHPQQAIAELQGFIKATPDGTRGIVLLSNDLGRMLRDQGRTEDAEAAYRRATTIEPNNVAAWEGLAATLLDNCRFAEAKSAVLHLRELPATARRTQRQLDQCESLLSVAADLPAILAGKKRPEKVSVQRAVADWCHQHKRRTATAAGLYESALSADPSLADDLEMGNRFHAACTAALAGCGLGDDAASLDDQQKAMWRTKALEWLKSDYNVWAKRHSIGKPGDRTAVARAMRSWLGNEDLAGVRDEQALARLPVEELRGWQAFWANVATLGARDPLDLFNRARDHVRQSEWKKAADCYRAGFDLEPTEDGELWFEYAAVQLLAENRAAYGRACADILARPSTRPYLAARVCTLTRNSADDTERASRLGRDELFRSAMASWSLTEQGALLVRAGQPTPAINLFARSLAADGRLGSALLNWLWLALAHQQLGNTKEARRWLDKATDWLDQQEGRMPFDTLYLGMHRHNWLEAQLLRREAESLLTAAVEK